jgi:hypothetical protein
MATPIFRDHDCDHNPRTARPWADAHGFGGAGLCYLPDHDHAHDHAHEIEVRNGDLQGTLSDYRFHRLNHRRRPADDDPEPTTPAEPSPTAEPSTPSA